MLDHGGEMLTSLSQRRGKPEKPKPGSDQQEENKRGLQTDNRPSKDGLQVTAVIFRQSLEEPITHR